MMQAPPFLPPAWDAEAARLWAQGRAADAVARAATAAHHAHWRTPDLALQCAYYLFQLGDFATAVQVLGEQVARTPHDAQVLVNLAVLHGRLGHWDAAVDHCERTLAIDADSATALDTLARSLHELGRDGEAAVAGTRALVLKDRKAPAADPAWRLPAGSPAEFAAGKRNVIALSLWGDRPRYLHGALRNVLLAPDLYPGWTVQLHVDASVPGRFLEVAGEAGAQVVRHAEGPLRERLARRFLVANDEGVGRFLVRDADSVINLREVQAVQAWVTSDRWFHAMRDWWTHTDLVLAGMWGGVAGALPDLADLLAAYQPPQAETANVDQWFLRDRVWPFLRASCLVHDRCFHMPGSEPFPGPVPEGNRHVGQDEYAVRRDEQARWLAPWLDRLEGGAVYQSLPARKAAEMPPGDDGCPPHEPHAA